jgi:hypothetical protein
MTEQTKRRRLFRLAIGTHYEADVRDIEAARKEGRPVKQRALKAGDVFESSTPELLMAENYREKFQLIPDGVPESVYQQPAVPDAAPTHAPIVAGPVPDEPVVADDPKAAAVVNVPPGLPNTTHAARRSEALADLNRKSVEELRDMAVQAELDLGKAKSKAEVVNRMMQFWDSKNPA